MTWFKILSRSPKPEKSPEKAQRKNRQAKPKKAPLTAEDHALWSEVARSIAPLPGRILPESIVAAPAQIKDHAPPSLHLSPAPSHPKTRPEKPALPPLARLEKRTLRALVRGSAEIEGRIDLHGMRQIEAHGALNAFLHRAHHSGIKLVLVITGKGSGTDSQGEERGVLRRLVPHWLADPGLRRIVLGYESAARGHGGEGALYVRLRRRKAP